MVGLERAIAAEGTAGHVGSGKPGASVHTHMSACVCSLQNPQCGIPQRGAGLVYLCLPL